MVGSLTEISLDDLRPIRKGKVRDVYDAQDGRLVIVATDRISAYDCILPSGIPQKGVILTNLSAFWFERVSHIVRTHFITCDPHRFPGDFSSYASVLAGRSMLVWKADPIEFECVVRGYLAGSAWREYRERGTVGGEPLRPGLKEASRFDIPLFTPARKAASGHDENVSFAVLEGETGVARGRELKNVSQKLFAFASEYCEKRGLILADSKFEFGLLDGNLILIDELFSPDSSRFWSSESYEPGRPQESFDKQSVRDYLRSTGWDGAPPAPPLPPDVVKQTHERYFEALERICGKGAL
ncbi:MAG: phosphoribosylaminoimidazolesuccinocarboxamide synthase [Candidatus Eisenbacteria bacterium]|nr:phosphoribosylaminoimidazolesuccinocarboxamide synthase [Candidatus Eisenbacteria bacterium]